MKVKKLEPNEKYFYPVLLPEIQTVCPKTRSAPRKFINIALIFTKNVHVSNKR